MDTISLPPEALPAGLSSRPLVAGDAPAVFEVMAAVELADLGVVDIEEADIVADWQRPSFDVTTSTIGVFDGDRLVGYAEVSGHDRGDAAVHPDVQGRGIGTALAGWMQTRVRTRGGHRIGMPVPEGSSGDRLLAALGYHVRWTSWILKLPRERTIVDRALPEGYVVRQATEADRRAVWTVIEDAFLEWSDRERQSFEDCAAGMWLRPGFEPWNIRVVTDAGGEVVGTAFVVKAGEEAWVDRLAVRRDQRHRGLAQVLLVDSFAVGREHGCQASCLSTDSRTGALSLYEKVGMEVTGVWVNRAIEV
ncbi:GNAT family N-acetyltransferase [Nocardioides sp. LHG3406-4]|uniref:GNAT family N-acetyltransferase n=1 Tax=Nocardioides sp. LHG3406-4 TaxID=2804575 RepID=UPI003CEF2379